MQAKFDRIGRLRTLDSIVHRWNPVEQNAYSELKQAADEFFDSSSRNEVDLSGTGRAAFEIEAKATLEENFARSLEEFEAGKLPRYTASDLSKAENALESMYEDLQSGTPRQPGTGATVGTVTPEGIRLTQSAWLKYREAWVRFGKVRYPTVTAESWRTWLTQARLEMWKHPL